MSEGHWWLRPDIEPCFAWDAGYNFVQTDTAIPQWKPGLDFLPRICAGGRPLNRDIPPSPLPFSGGEDHDLFIKREPFASFSCHEWCILSRRMIMGSFDAT